MDHCNLNERRRDGIQGRRLRSMSDAFHRTVKFALRGMSYEDFSGYFPNLEQRVIDVIYDAYKQTLHQTRVFTEADFDQLCHDSRLGDTLVKLEQMCEQQGITDDGEAATDAKVIDPTMAVRVALFAAKKGELTQLEMVYQQVAAESNTIAEQRQEMVDALEELKGKLQPITSHLKQVDAAAKSWANRVTTTV